MSTTFLTPRVGLEPTTSRLTAVRSTIELSRIIIYSKLHAEFISFRILFSEVNLFFLVKSSTY